MGSCISYRNSYVKKIFHFELKIFDKIFHGENMLTELEKKFCQSLKEYVDKNIPYEKGYISKLSKKIGISQGQLSNILAERKASDEETRRKISEIIGIEYDVMIGLKEKPNSNGNLKVINFPNKKKETTPEYEAMHNDLDAIIDSKDDGLIASIKANLTSFVRIASLEKTVTNQNRKMKLLEGRLKALEGSG